MSCSVGIVLSQVRQLRSLWGGGGGEKEGRGRERLFLFSPPTPCPFSLVSNIYVYKITMNIHQPPDSIAKLCLNISDKMAQENKSGLINKINLLCSQLNIKL